MTKNIILKQNKNDMDTRDLRIGDFVYYTDEKCKIIEISRSQVAMLRGRLYKCGLTDVSDIQPIPLTDELLEKIAFKNKIRASHSLGYRFVSDTCYALIWHIKESDAYLIRTLNNESVTIGEKRISYLHQLQHELYDAGDIKIELE